MIGLHRTTGRPVADLAHLEQSVVDILTTPLGSRIMRRDYGSEIPALIDQPLTDGLRLRLYAATVAALTAWEPRVRVLAVTLTQSTAGRAELTVDLAMLTGGTLTLGVWPQ